MIKKEKRIEGVFGRDICFDITMPETKKSLPVVVFLHGFKGFKDWGAWHLVADYFAAHGWAFIKINFSYGGVDPDNLSDLTDGNAFAENNFLMELSDVSQVLDWIGQQSYLDANHISLIGHSRAGGIALITAKEQDRVEHVVTWAAVSDYHRYIGSWDIEQWKKNGVLEFVNSRTKQVMQINYSFYEVLKANNDFFDLKKIGVDVQQKVLIVHAKDDVAVNYSEAEELNQWIPGSELLLLETGGHTFDTHQPYEDIELPSTMKKVCQRTVQFLSGGVGNK